MTWNGRRFTGEYVAFSAFDRVALTALINSVAHDGMLVLEVGSWLGHGSTTTIASAIRTERGRLYCVDTWEGSPNVPRHRALVAEYDAFATFQATIAGLDATAFVHPLIMPSRHAARIVADAVLDLVFIDGDHSYTATVADIAAWRPKVRRGGILCGHDCESRVAESDRTQWVSFAEDDTCAAPASPFGYVHPGVCLAVNEAFGLDTELYAERRICLADGTPGSSSIWYVQL